MKIVSTIKQPLITPTPPFLEDQEFDELLRHSYHNNNNHNDNDNQHIEIFFLRDPPITKSTTPKTTVSHRPSSSDPTSDFFFEFLTNNDELITSFADDVISNGRLLPFAPPPPRRSLSFSSAAAWLTCPQLTDSPSESSSLPAIRSSRSLNYRKLHQHHHHRPKPKPKSKSKPKPKSKQKDNLLHNHRCNIYNSDIVRAKFPWYWMGFGLPVKIASEMELKDIKNRQFRREPAPPTGRVVSGGRNCSSSSSASWKFLNVLSCKSHATVEVNKKSPFRNSLM